MKGLKKEFYEHDIFLAGRSPDCHFHIPKDNYLSRHHFLLEINPPDTVLRDLGSKNGTFVNGVRYGGRSRKEAQKEASKRAVNIDLRDGDKLKVGDTEIVVKVEGHILCVDCREKIPDEKRQEAEFIGGSYLCEKCRNKAGKQVKPEKLQFSPCMEEVMKIVEVSASPPAPPPAPVKKEKLSDPDLMALALMKQILFAKRNIDVEFPEIEGYEIKKLLGRGGFGAVYLALDNKTGKEVALKILIETRVPREANLEMFKREIETLKKLKHPNIVNIADYGRYKNIHYFALEYMNGGSLWDSIMEKGRIPFYMALPIMLQSLEGLAFAHKKEIIHRDIKPPNILLSGKDTALIVKISDFGLAKNFARAGMTKNTVTIAGQFCGSPPYMSPEHITSYRYVKPPTDVFEIAATFYHMLTGVTIRDISENLDPCLVILQGKIKPIRHIDRNIPQKVGEVIDRALSREPLQRYKDGGEMLKALKEAL